MISIEHIETDGWKAAIRGMRNPMNSWNKSDSEITPRLGVLNLGKNDYDLMTRLAKAGPVHGKFLRMITVTMDIVAPLYWWKEFDTYKVGTVANSCSTMHKLHERPLNFEDFSHEHLSQGGMSMLSQVITRINKLREKYLKTKDKKYWWEMIQLLPTSYNQRRTVLMNYEVLRGIYHYRKDHKLDEWRLFCGNLSMILPYPELFKGDDGDVILEEEP